MYWKIIQPVKHKSVLVTLKRKKLDNLPNTLVEVNGLELAHTFDFIDRCSRAPVLRDLVELRLPTLSKSKEKRKD